jgi:hypothetical protein
MMLISLVLFLIMTSLMLYNATRMNVEQGISDVALNAVIFFLGTQSISVLGAMPIQVALTYIVPQNVEASTMALISGCIVWSYEVGAKISCSIYCQIFEVDDEHMDNYPHILVAKIPMILLMILLILILPRNEQISKLADKLRKEHIKKR